MYASHLVYAVLKVELRPWCMLGQRSTWQAAPSCAMSDDFTSANPDEINNLCCWVRNVEGGEVRHGSGAAHPTVNLIGLVEPPRERKCTANKSVHAS